MSDGGGPRVIRVVSGGQSGVDRAAVDFAIAVGVAYGGWVPRGGWAEDFADEPGLLARYHDFAESASSDPNERTLLNVRDSTATVTLGRGDFASAGVARARAAAIELARPLLDLDLTDPGAGERLGRFLYGFDRPVTLNLAGPRESESPGIYDATLAFLAANRAYFQTTD